MRQLKIRTGAASLAKIALFCLHHIQEVKSETTIEVYKPSVNVKRILRRNSITKALGLQKITTSLTETDEWESGAWEYPMKNKSKKSKNVKAKKCKKSKSGKKSKSSCGYAFQPTGSPESNTMMPTQSPVSNTMMPTQNPVSNTMMPIGTPARNISTTFPSEAQSGEPSSSSSPTSKPTVKMVPTEKPSSSSSPTSKPTLTMVPTEKPSSSSSPTSKPTVTMVPTENPTRNESQNPSSIPTESLSGQPSITVSLSPTLDPSTSLVPTQKPTRTVSVRPTIVASQFPSGRPSQTPTETFDLQDCETYSNRWLFDLSESCDDTFQSCTCDSAEKLIDSGRIDCKNDMCPPSCVMCNYCLEDVLPCMSSEASVPAQIQKSTVVESIVPMLANSPFDLLKCESYEHQWLRDLDNTCTVDQSGKAKNCDCEDAKRRISHGEITCGESKCPDDCEVCKFCLDEIKGCLA